MGLDYTNGCVNFRDVGEYVNLLMGRPVMKEKSLYRGGKIQHIVDLGEIGHARTIINLRRGPDPHMEGTVSRHFPISNDYEKYDTADKVVARWLSEIVRFIAREECALPALLHCTSGKDRTGVAVAAILKILGIPDDVIVEEYLLSDGEVDRSWIQLSLAGIGHPSEYFRRAEDLRGIQARLGVDAKSGR